VGKRKIFALILLYTIFYRILSMLPYYLGKSEVLICTKSGKKCKENALIFTHALFLSHCAYLRITNNLTASISEVILAKYF